MEHLPIEKLQAQATPAIDVLLVQSEMSDKLRRYLISCQVEGKSAATTGIYTYTITSFIRFLEENLPTLSLSTISTDDVRLFLLSLQNRNLSPSTVQSHYRALNTFFNWLVNEGYLKTSPMARIKPPRVSPDILIKPFTRHQIDDLVLLCSGKTFIDLRNRAIVFMFLDTGLRLAELAGIKLTDIDIDQRTITVLGKGGKERRVKFGHETKKVLLRYVLARDDKYNCLWVTRTRTPMTRRGVQTAIFRLCTRAEIVGAKRGPHSFRHTAAMAFLMNSEDPFALQTLLGHSTLEMTRRYTRSLQEKHMLNVYEKASPVDNMRL